MGPMDMLGLMLRAICTEPTTPRAEMMAHVKVHKHGASSAELKHALRMLRHFFACFKRLQRSMDTSSALDHMSTAALVRMQRVPGPH